MIFTYCQSSVILTIAWLTLPPVNKPLKWLELYTNPIPDKSNFSSSCLLPTSSKCNCSLVSNAAIVLVLSQ